MMDLKGKGAFVTGGADGIGRAITESLLERGARVLFCDVSEAAGATTLAQLLTKHAESDIMFHRCDVTDATQLTETFEKAVRAFGAIEVCVNNAGIMDETAWEKMIQVNQIALIRGCYLALEHMRKDKGGRGGSIINMASVNGLLYGQAEIPVYMATKRAIVGFTTSWANNPDQSAHGVRWGVICPEGVVTSLNSNFGETRRILRQTPGGPPPVPDATRLAGQLRPADVALSAMTLLDDESSNGDVIRVSRDQTTRNSDVIQTVLTMDKRQTPVENLLVKKVINSPPCVLVDEV